MAIAARGVLCNVNMVDIDLERSEEWKEAVEDAYAEGYVPR